MCLKFKLLSFILLFSGSFVFAQSNSAWNPIGLTVDGRNVQNGVEAFYQQKKCNKEEVIFIKFINTNTYDVIVEWNDAVFTGEHKWLSNEKGDNKKSVTITSNQAVSADCSSTSHPELFVKLNDFIKNINEFNSFRTLSFQVTVINK